MPRIVSGSLSDFVPNANPDFSSRDDDLRQWRNVEIEQALATGYDWAVGARGDAANTGQGLMLRSNLVNERIRP